MIKFNGQRWEAYERDEYACLIFVGEYDSRQEAVAALDALTFDRVRERIGFGASD